MIIFRDYYILNILIKNDYSDIYLNSFYGDKMTTKASVDNKKLKKGNDLKGYIDDFFNDLVLYDDWKNKHQYKDLLHASVIRFLDEENTYTANEIYENFFMIYQITDEDKSEVKNKKSTHVSESNTLLELVNLMRDYEDNTGDLIEKQRDHFIHSVNVFILGLAIYSNNKRYREAFQLYVINSPYKKYYKTEDGKFSREEFLYRWGIASLFHDIGYPVEIIGKQLSKFVNDGSQSISRKYKVNTAVNFKNFDELNSIIRLDPKFPVIYRRDYTETNFIDLYKPTDIMAHQIFTDLYVGDGNAIDQFDKLSGDLEKLIKHLDNFVDYMAENGFIDHGFFSAIFVLNSYAALMQNVYKDLSPEKYAYFFYPVANSATSILLHNYYRGTLNKEESKTDEFNLGPLKPNQSPLAFLLILCDELQEWNRKPIGIKDKAKNHVNDIKIEINADDITVQYILKNSALGLNFSEDKEGLINRLLDVKSIFSEGLRVKMAPDLDKDSPLEDISLSDAPVPNILLRNVKEIARSSHARYKELEDKEGNIKKEYDELSARDKLSSVRQVKQYPKKLNLIGCEIVPMDDSRDEHILTPEEIEYIAVVEHDDWMEEKRKTGWISPEEALKSNLISQELHDSLMATNEENCTDSENNKYVDEENGILVHANLIPFDKLNKYTQDKDSRPFEDMALVLSNIKGNPLKIVDNQLKTLTISIHDTYKEYVSGKEEVPEFNKLPFEIQHNNYKQTHLILKFLSELNYDVVDIEDKKEGITLFDDKEIEYLAKREHNAWYLRKLNDDYYYGEVKEGKQNPKLLSWDELGLDSKKSNLHTFKKLPENFKAVGLKIIKSK